MTIKIDFSSIGKKKDSAPPNNLLETFDQLDRKASHESLRPAQIEALGAMNGQIKEKDIVLKLGTGAGKTVIGLVYAEHMRRVYPGELVVFLCTTRQLVDQVCQSAQLVGVQVEQFPHGGMPYASLEGRAVLVCTYDKVFNGRSVFETNNLSPAAIILDDVHAGIARVQQTFSINFPVAAYTEIRKLLDSSCSLADPGAWRAIQNNETDARFEVPFWVYKTSQKSIFDILEKYSEESELKFNLANLRRYSEFCRLCLTGSGGELSYYVSPVEEIRSFSNAKHRLLMSASIKDGGALVRELGCSPSALTRVIEPASDKGVGERMIIPVSLIDASLKREQLGVLCKELSGHTNVVVLCSSHRQSVTWVTAGAKLADRTNMDGALEVLRSTPKGNFFVFAQRFDGLDLADDACRILVLDGIPSGERLSDDVDNRRQKAVPSHYIDAVNKFEQALGRAVRSSADFAAVLLVGNDLASFIGRKAVKDFLEPPTLKQIEIGKSISEQLAGAGASLEGISHAIKQLLSRDASWKEGHREAMALVAKSSRTPGVITENEQIADAERKAWLAVKGRKLDSAIQILSDAINLAKDSPYTRAELFYRMATYFNFVDGGKALTVHHSAYELNPDLPRPVQMPNKKYVKATAQVTNFLSQFSDFTSVKAAISHIEELKVQLSYGHQSEAVEAALQRLGEIVGANASRPERETNRGPDILWQFPDISFCIEAKSEKTAPIYKDDAKQLLLSTEWCRQEAGLKEEEIVSVFATNSFEFDRKEDVSFGPLVLSETTAVGIAEDVKRVLSALSFDGPLFSDAAKVAALIGEAKLSPRAIQARLSSFK
jgi:hypothetical protein